MPKINELLEFEEIKEVIDIDIDLDTEESKENIVKDYIISERLKEYLINLADNLNKPKHKSIIIIGGYGSGKSHLLGWIVSLLENKDLIQYISHEEILSKFKEELKRDFAVVQFELQPGASALSDYFFDRIQTQLDEKYNIEIRDIDTSKPVDYKKEIEEIVSLVKKENQKRGLVVLIDEISDFLKQKTKHQINRDIQFLRILGQVSQSLDFLFIGSMQENVFSSPKYIDEAEGFGRVHERFEIVTISREDIERVISKRVLKKSLSQRNELDELLADYKKEFPQINSDPDKFIDLFPIHPYVIKLFSELEFFEKRGVIQFAIDRIKNALTNEFPFFITIDSIYDEINSKHTIRNQDVVRPIIEVIETLDTKIDLLDQRFQDTARKLVKVLGVLNLYGKTTSNGATPLELANELLITSKTLKNEDWIVIILDKIRELTDGQFISKTENNYFFIDLKAKIDYDLVIERKIQNLAEGTEDQELLRLIKYIDLIDAKTAESYTRIFKDYCSWLDKKSFRLGNFIYNDKSSQAKRGDMDFNLILNSPYGTDLSFNSSKDTAILNIPFNEEIDKVLKTLGAIRLLISENYVKSIMQKKYNKFEDEAKEIILKFLLESDIEIDGNKKKNKTVLKKEPDTIDEFFHSLKENLFNDYFNSKYKNYPKFLTQISFESIHGLVEEGIKELIQKGEKNLFSNIENILLSLNLLDTSKDIDTSNSLYAQIILEELDQKKGTNVKIKKLADKLKSEPIGLNPEMIYLVLVVLTYNGEINLKKKGGITITSSDLSDAFKVGLKAFNQIPYATLETEFPVDSIIKLFKAIELNPGLIRNPKDRIKAVQEFRTKILEIQNQLKLIKNNISDIRAKPSQFIDINSISQEIEKLNEIPIEELLKVKAVNDFKKVEYDDIIINQIKNNLTLLKKIKEFFDDYNEFIYKEYVYLDNSYNWINKFPSIFLEADKKSLNKIIKEIKSIFETTDNLFNREQRRILRGKLQQYKKEYTVCYFNKHADTVGKNIKWNNLESINKSKELTRLRDMKAIRCINTLKLNKLDQQILTLSQAKCNIFIEDHLNESILCPWCKFPEKLKDIGNINQEIEEISKTIEEISREWIKTLLEEINQYRDNIDKLIDAEKTIIIEIETNMVLPDDISQEIINALNNLFSELQLIEIKPTEIVDFVFSKSDILDYDSFVVNIEQYKKSIIKGKDKRNIRLKKKET
jgi:hypothetical protein